MRIQSEAEETCDNTRWNVHCARSCDHHQQHSQRSYKAKVHRGPRAASGGCREQSGMAVLVSMATLQASEGPQAGESVLKEPACVPSACLCTVHGKIYLHIYMPNAFYAKSLRIALEE